jgi:hypothetical protein
MAQQRIAERKFYIPITVHTGYYRQQSTNFVPPNTTILVGCRS